MRQPPLGKDDANIQRTLWTGDIRWFLSDRNLFAVLKKGYKRENRHYIDRTDTG